MSRKLGSEWLPLIFASTLGFSGTPTLPIWLAAAAERFHLTAPQSGLLASLELGCMAFASIASAALAFSSLRPLAFAIALSIVGNLGSLLATDALTLTAARAVVGLSYGVTLAEITRRAAQMPDPHRVFAMQQLGLVLFATVFFTTAPKLIASLGAPSLFLYNMVMGALALASIAWLPLSTDASVTGASASRAGKRSVAVAMTFVAIVLSFAAYGSLWTYIAEAAKSSGLPLDALSRTLAIGAVANLLAPLAAGRLGLRYGRVTPLLLGYAGFALSMLMIALGLGPAWFAAGAIGLNLFLLFLGPFLLGTLAGLDASGRGAAVGPAFFTIGGAIGPAVGGFVIGNAGFPIMGIIGAMAAGGALGLAWVAGSRIPVAKPAVDIRIG